MTRKDIRDWKGNRPTNQERMEFLKGGNEVFNIRRNFVIVRK